MENTTSKSKLLQIELIDPAAVPTDAARWDQVQALFSGTSQPGHAHSPANITGLQQQVLDWAWAHLGDSETVVLTREHATNDDVLQARVKIDPNGGLASGTGGLGVDWGSGSNQVPRGNHSHAQLHDPVTLASGTSINFSLSGQVLGAEVRLKPNQALQIGQDGLELRFGTTAETAAAGNHSHAQLHDAVTLVSTPSVALYFSGTSQGVAAEVRRKVTSLSATQGFIDETPDGLVARLGPSGTEAAPGNHTHAVATQSAPGFMSVEDKTKLDLHQSLLLVEQSVPFVRGDMVHPAGVYVGGRRRWGQAMQVLNMHVSAIPPVGASCVLGLEIDGAVVEHLVIPAGTPPTEVLNFRDLESGAGVHIAADKYVRMVLVSGVADFENAPSMIDAVLTVRPSIASLGSLKINAGGGAVTPFAADAYYGAGGSVQTDASAIDLSGATGPAPQSVYQSARVKYGNPDPLEYEFTGLARGIAYLVRLHWAELYWGSIGQQKMKVEAIGKTTATLNNYDTLSETSGTKFKAVIKELTVEPNTDGKIKVRLSPLVSMANTFNLSINGVELVPVIS